MTKAEIKKTARECIQHVRALYPGKPFVFVIVEREDGQRCVAAVIEDEPKGPIFATINGPDMWAVSRMCNKLLRVKQAAADAINALGRVW
jgi:hypothetical protein